AGVAEGLAVALEVVEAVDHTHGVDRAIVEAAAVVVVGGAALAERDRRAVDRTAAGRVGDSIGLLGPRHALEVGVHAVVLDPQLTVAAARILAVAVPGIAVARRSVAVSGIAVPVPVPVAV